MKYADVYIAVSNLHLVNDIIEQGTKSFKVEKGKAYFYTKRGTGLSFPIDEMNEFYFKK